MCIVYANMNWLEQSTSFLHLITLMVKQLYNQEWMGWKSYEDLLYKVNKDPGKEVNMGTHKVYVFIITCYDEYRHEKSSKHASIVRAFFEKIVDIFA